jgi:hypothetical protein
LLAEVNEQRLIARGLEPRLVGCRSGHAGKVYSRTTAMGAQAV